MASSPIQLSFRGGLNEDVYSALAPLFAADRLSGVRAMMPDQVKVARDVELGIGTGTVRPRRPVFWVNPGRNAGLALPYPHLLLKRFWDGSQWRYFCATSHTADQPAMLWELTMPNEDTGNGMGAAQINRDDDHGHPVPLLDDLPLSGVAYNGDAFIINGGQPIMHTNPAYHTCYRGAVMVKRGDPFGVMLPWVDTGDATIDNPDPGWGNMWGHNRFPSCRTAWVTNAFVVAGGQWGQPIKMDTDEFDDSMNDSMVRWCIGGKPTWWRNKDWFTVYPDDGDAITHGVALRDNSVVFKNRHIYLLVGSVPPWTECVKIADHGCPFPETVQPFEGGLVYLNDYMELMYYNGEGSSVRLSHPSAMEDTSFPSMQEYLKSRRAPWFTGHGIENDRFQDDGVGGYDYSKTARVEDGSDVVALTSVAHEIEGDALHYSGQDGDSAQWSPGPNLVGGTRAALFPVFLATGNGKMATSSWLRRISLRVGGTLPVGSALKLGMKETTDWNTLPTDADPVFCEVDGTYDGTWATFLFDPKLLVGKHRFWCEVFVPDTSVLRFEIRGEDKGEQGRHLCFYKDADGHWTPAKYDPAVESYPIDFIFEAKVYPANIQGTVAHNDDGSNRPFSVDNPEQWGDFWFECVTPSGTGGIAIYVEIQGSEDGALWPHSTTYRVPWGTSGKVTVPLQMPASVHYLRWSMRLREKWYQPSVVTSAPSVGYYSTSGGYSIKRIPCAAVVDNRYVLSSCAPDSDYNNDALVLQPEHPNAPLVLGTGSRPVFTRWTNIQANHMCIFTLDRKAGATRYREDHLAWSGLAPVPVSSPIIEDSVMLLGREQSLVAQSEGWLNAQIYDRTNNVDFLLETHRMPVGSVSMNSTMVYPRIVISGKPGSAYIEGVQIHGQDGEIQQFLMKLIGDLAYGSANRVEWEKALGYVDTGESYDLHVGSLDVAGLVLQLSYQGQSGAVYVRSIVLSLDQHGRGYRG